MNNIVFLKSKFGPAPRTCEECVGIDIVAWSFTGKYPPSVVSVRQTHSPDKPSTSKHFSRSEGGLKFSQIMCVFIHSHTTKTTFEWSFLGGLEAWLAHAETRGPEREEGAFERALMPGAAAKRPHSRITSQKRLACCDTGNRMAFVSFRIMSSPGHITLNKTSSADANVITGEMMLSFSVNIY